MYDNPELTARLLQKLKDELPMRGRLPTAMRAMLESRAGSSEIPDACWIIAVLYTIEGGIKCVLDLGRDVGDFEVRISITKLEFDPRQPLAREIAAYRKRRMKRLRWAGVEGTLLYQGQRPDAPDVGA